MNRVQKWLSNSISSDKLLREIEVELADQKDAGATALSGHIAQNKDALKDAKSPLDLRRAISTGLAGDPNLSAALQTYDIVVGDLQVSGGRSNSGSWASFFGWIGRRGPRGCVALCDRQEPTSNTEVLELLGQIPSLGG
jgi:hypothetical protein